MKDDILEKPEEKSFSLLDVLKKVSPGRVLRTAIDDIVSGRMGALIVVDSPSVKGIFKGGFKINCILTAQKLVELSKMDGAIILSSDLSKILYANTLLIPNPEISSVETGTRHKAAERTAKQTNTLVVAVSERKGSITVYQGNIRYVLIDTEDILRRAIDTLQILERQREVFDELLINLNVLEMTNLVSVGDVCSVIQRLEMVNKMSGILNRYIVELGKEGTIVRMRLREVIKGLRESEDFILKDYTARPTRAKNVLTSMSFDSLLDLENISKIAFSYEQEKQLSPKGYRMLNSLGLNEKDTKNLITEFKNFDGILKADDTKLAEILKSSRDDFRKKIDSLKDQVMVGRKI